MSLGFLFLPGLAISMLCRFKTYYLFNVKIRLFVILNVCCLFLCTRTFIIAFSCLTIESWKVRMKAKLLKQLDYKDKDICHYKHVIVIPEEAVNELGWNDGQHLELTITDWRLIIEAKE